MRYHVYSARGPVRMFFTLDADLRAALEARAAADDASLSAVFNRLMAAAFEPELRQLRRDKAIAEDGPLRRLDRPDGPGMTVRVDPRRGVRGHQLRRLRRGRRFGGGRDRVEQGPARSPRGESARAEPHLGLVRGRLPLVPLVGSPDRLSVGRLGRHGSGVVGEVDGCFGLGEARRRGRGPLGSPGERRRRAGPHRPADGLRPAAGPESRIRLDCVDNPGARWRSVRVEWEADHLHLHRRGHGRDRRLPRRRPAEPPGCGQTRQCSQPQVFSRAPRTRIDYDRESPRFRPFQAVSGAPRGSRRLLYVTGRSSEMGSGG